MTFLKYTVKCTEEQAFRASLDHVGAKCFKTKCIYCCAMYAAAVFRKQWSETRFIWFHKNSERSQHLQTKICYLGQDERRKCSIPLGEFVVVKLMQSFRGCGRKVATHNFFHECIISKEATYKKDYNCWNNP